MMGCFRSSRIMCCLQVLHLSVHDIPLPCSSFYRHLQSRTLLGAINLIIPVSFHRFLVAPQFNAWFWRQLSLSANDYYSYRTR
jgi:hypothetical protein